jgi:hypothetical protein
MNYSAVGGNNFNFMTMKPLLVILIAFLPSFIFAGIPGNDTISRIAIKVNPLQIISLNEVGCTIEYSFHKRFAIEVGGGISNGYTFRAGFKVKKRNGLYYGPAIFYRQRNYQNREYKWNKGSNLGAIMETSPDPGYGSGSDYSYKEIANETKQVLCIQGLIGWEFLLWKCVPIDLYAGVGYRYKHRVKEISTHMNYLRGTIENEEHYSTPHKVVIDSYLPSIQAGIQFGFSFPLKKR